MIKAGIAGRDPFEKGERRLLNLGHTFTHAIEKLSGEKIPHGEAVSIGIVLAARLAGKLGLAETCLSDRLESDFKACGMPVICPFEVGELTGAMRKDKKAEGNIIHFILPSGIGDVNVKDMTPAEATRLLQE